MKIRIIGDPVLKERITEMGLPYPGLKGLIKNMADVMYEAPGVGLAANQIGVLARMCLVDIGEGLQVLINPRMVHAEGEETEEEGCLSLPTITVPVKRFERVVVEALNEKGEPLTIEAEGLLARVLQHEIDHLEGNLLLDRIDREERRRIMHDLNEKMGLL